MSLIGIWRDRREAAIGPTRPPRLWKLIAGFVIVAVLIWRLSQLV
jgi:hypothetical protein